MAAQVPGMAASTASTNGENYVLIGSYDIYDREFFKDLIPKVPRARALGWMKALKGYMSKRKVNRDVYYFHEEGQYFATIATIAAVSDQTTFVRITLSAADHDNSGTTSYPIVGNTVVFENEVVGYVSVVTRSVASAHTVDVYPVDTATNNILASAVVGTKMSFFSNTQQEASTQTEVRTPKTTKVTNYVQTLRNSYRVTDVAKRQHTEFEYKGQKFLYVKGIDDMMDTQMLNEELAMLINPASSSLVNAGGNPLTLAKGFVPQITDNGNTMEYFGTPDKTTWDDAVLILNRNYAMTEYMVPMGLPVMQGLENWLKDFNEGGDNGISFNAFNGGKKQAISLDFQSIRTSGRTFHFQVWDILSHSDSIGADGFPYKDMLYLIPTGMTANKGYDGDVETNGREYEPFIGLIYADTGHQGASNKGDHAVWSTGALAPTPTNDVQEWRVHIVSTKSLEIRCRNKFMVMRKAA